MKKSIAIAFTIFAIGFVSAQDLGTQTNGFVKGNKFVEGAFSVRTGNTEQGVNDVKTSYKFNPKFGYMIEDKLAIGADLDVSAETFYGGATATAADTKKTATFGAGVFARYYFLELGNTKSFNAYAEAGFGYSGTRAENAAGDETDKYNGVKFNIDLGMNYFFTNHWAATFELANILSYNTLSQNDDTTSGLNVSINEFNNIFATPTFGLLYRW